MSIDQIASEALKLPARDRATLAESLWDSLTDPFKLPDEKDDSATIELAFERDRQISNKKVKSVSHQEMMSRLRQ